VFWKNPLRIHPAMEGHRFDQSGDGPPEKSRSPLYPHLSPFLLMKKPRGPIALARDDPSGGLLRAEAREARAAARHREVLLPPPPSNLLLLLLLLALWGSLLPLSRTVGTGGRRSEEARTKLLSRWNTATASRG
jgi:hypothetical protein